MDRTSILVSWESRISTAPRPCGKTGLCRSSVLEVSEILDWSEIHPIPMTLEELTASGASLSPQIFFVLTRFFRGPA